MRNILLLVSLLSLVSCSSAPKKEIAELADITNTLNIKPLWVIEAGKASPDQHNQLPITIEDNKIFIANAKGLIEALNLNNGKSIWQKDLGEVILSGPGYGENIVVVTTEEEERLIVIFSLEVGGRQIPHEFRATIDPRFDLVVGDSQFDRKMKRAARIATF